MLIIVFIDLVVFKRVVVLIKRIIFMWSNLFFGIEVLCVLYVELLFFVYCYWRRLVIFLDLVVWEWEIWFFVLVLFWIWFVGFSWSWNLVLWKFFLVIFCYEDESVGLIIGKRVWKIVCFIFKLKFVIRCVFKFFLNVSESFFWLLLINVLFWYGFLKFFNS